MAFDPVLVATNTNNAVPPATARLSGGGNVVVWAENTQPMARLTTAAGVPGEAFAISPGSTAAISSMSVTAAPDGGFLVLWVDEVAPSISQFSGKLAVELKRFAADGTVRWQRQLGQGQMVGRPMARATPTGFVVGWTSNNVFTMPEQAFMQLLAADGSSVGPTVEVGLGVSAFQHQLNALPLQDGSILAVWSQGDVTRQVYMRRYDANLAPLGTAVPVAGTETTGRALLDAQVLATGDVALAWSLAPPQPHPVYSAVVGTDGTLRSAIHTVTPDRDVEDVRVVPLGAGGYGLVWDMRDANYRLVWDTLWLQQFDNAGVTTGAPQQLDLRYLSSASAVSGITQTAGAGFDIAGGADGHFVAVFNRIQSSTYLMGR